MSRAQKRRCLTAVLTVVSDDLLDVILRTTINNAVDDDLINLLYRFRGTNLRIFHNCETILRVNNNENLKKNYAFLLALEKSVCPQAPLALGNGPGIVWSTVTSDEGVSGIDPSDAS